jgi:hypothetical protein
MWASAGGRPWEWQVHLIWTISAHKVRDSTLLAGERAYVDPTADGCPEASVGNA